MNQTLNGRIYLGQEQKWVVTFKNGQIVHAVALTSTSAMKNAARAICQPISEVIEVITKEMSDGEHKCRPEEW